MHKVTTVNFNMMIRSLQCMMNKAREMPTYDGEIGVDELLDKFERSVPKQQWYGGLEWLLHTTPTRWWQTNQKNVGS